MSKIRLGRTGLRVERNGFGALPIQRVGFAEAERLVRRAFDNGIEYYDTARGYTDSEEKLGRALSSVRDGVVLASKTMSREVDGFWADLHTSLTNLRTDRIDVFQFHNPAVCYRPGDGSGMYEAMLEARSQGKIRFIGMTNHREGVAREAVESGLYDTMQFPFSYLSGERDEALVRLCAERDIGFVCMKGLAGGLITAPRAAYAYIAQFAGALPIWGIQREEELDDFLGCMSDPPALDDTLGAVIERDRAELRGGFCRGCGYCLPCPAGIDIPTAARMTLMLRRNIAAPFTTPEQIERMERVDGCVNCRHCADHCPYGLDTPALLKENLRQYRETVAAL